MANKEKTLEQIDREQQRDAETKAKAEKKAAKERLKAEETYKIVLPATEDTADVPVGINGHLILIKRGVPVEVPKSVYEILHNAELV